MPLSKGFTQAYRRAKNSVAKPRPNRRGGLWKTKCPLKMGKNEAMKNKTKWPPKM
jgi:hypothetical protein